MINSRLVRSAAVLLGVAAFAACSKSSTTTSTSPAPAASTTVTSPAAAPAALPYTAAMVAMGDSIYHARGCRNCHGMDAHGSVGGPNLVHPDHWLHVDGSYQGFVNLITTGVPAAEIKDPSHRNAMAPRGGRPTPLTDDQIKAVAAYVYSLNHT